MSAFALWSNLPYNVGAPGVNFSADCTIAYFAGNYVISAWSDNQIASGKYAFCLQFNPVSSVGTAGVLLGIADTASLVHPNTPANMVGIGSNGNVYTYVSGSLSTLYNISGAGSSSTAMWLFDMGAKLAWVTVDGTNFYGIAGTALTAGNVQAGIGGIPITFITTANSTAYLYYGTGTAGLISNPANYPWSAPSGFSPLPATLQTTATTSAAGTPTSISWTSSVGIGTLQYTLMGGSPITCGGTNSGTAGTATINTPSGGEVDLFVLSDGASTLTASPTITVYTSNTPPFSGPTLVSAGGVLADNSGGVSDPTKAFYELPSNYNATFSSVQTLVLGYSLDVLFPPSFVGIGTPTLHVYTDTAGVDFYFILQGSTSGSGTLTNEILYGDTLSETRTTLATTSAVGLVTLTLLSGGTSVLLERNINGESASGTVAITESTGFGSIYFEGNFDIAYFQAFSFGIEASGPPPTETLTLTSASTPGGTAGILSVGGLDANAVMGTLYLDVDGAGFDPAASSSFTVGSLGTDFNGTGGSLSIGTHTVQAENPATGAVSNVRSVVVSAGAALRVSQSVLQVWMEKPPADLRVSQSVLQVWLAPTPNSRVGLYMTNVLPSATDSYIEFGTQMSWAYITALLPNNGEQRNNAMIVTTLDMEFIGNTPVVNVQFNNSAGGVLEAASVVPTGAVSVWNGTAANSTWNEVPWNGVRQPLSPYQLAWPAPVVFQQGSFTATGLSSAGFKIGTLYMQYQVLGYVSQFRSGAS